MKGDGLRRISAAQCLQSRIINVLLLVVTSDTLIVDGDGKAALFYNIKGASLVGNVILVKQTRTELECALFCLQMYIQSCFSFNFERGTSGTKLRNCELSNSERALEPHKMMSREGFDYFGIESVFLSRYSPCPSTQCRNGGFCVNRPALDRLSCNCPLEIGAMPYVDNNCNFNDSLIEIQTQLQGFFQVRVGRYQLNYFEAGRLCEILGTTLASWEQLTAAWNAGLQHCAWGWLIDARVALPMREAHNKCGNKIGIVELKNVDKMTSTFNAWCNIP